MLCLSRFSASDWILTSRNRIPISVLRVSHRSRLKTRLRRNTLPVSCPYCYKEPAARMEEERARCERAIRGAAIPLPGSVPYDNYRPLRVPDTCHGFTVVDFFSAILPHKPRELWETACREGRLLDENRTPLTEELPVRCGQQVLHLHSGTSEPAIYAAIRVLHVDEALIVINKPAPLPFHPGGRFNRNTLQYLLSVAFHPQRPRPAPSSHRCQHHRRHHCLPHPALRRPFSKSNSCGAKSKNAISPALAIRN